MNCARWIATGSTTIWDVVAPWLYRACIRAGAKPGGCSDDANAHP
jgi:hypothetical protein